MIVILTCACCLVACAFTTAKVALDAAPLVVAEESTAREAASLALKIFLLVLASVMTLVVAAFMLPHVSGGPS